jgi:hypothetical protein
MNSGVEQGGLGLVFHILTHVSPVLQIQPLYSFVRRLLPCPPSPAEPGHLLKRPFMYLLSVALGTEGASPWGRGWENWVVNVEGRWRLGRLPGGNDFKLSSGGSGGVGQMMGGVSGLRKQQVVCLCVLERSSKWLVCGAGRGSSGCHSEGGGSCPRGQGQGQGKISCQDT